MNDQLSLVGITEQTTGTTPINLGASLGKRKLSCSLPDGKQKERVNYPYGLT